MAVRISENNFSLLAQKNLHSTNVVLQKSVANLSSGLRLDTARDQGGLSVVNRIDPKLRSINGDVRNANDGISLAQVAEGGLNEVANNLQRMRQLAVQAANDVNGADDRQALQQELTQRNDEIDRIAGNSQVNGQKLLDGSFNGSNVQIGASNTVAISGIANTQASALGRIEGNNADQGLRSIDLSTAAGANDAIARIDKALSSVDGSRSAMGASQNRVSAALDNAINTQVQTPKSRVQDVNVEDIRARSEQLSNQIRQQAGAAILAQANQMPQSALSLLRG